MTIMQINWTEERNLTMLTDYYEFTMSNGYFLNGMKDKIAVFDMFFRNIPDGGGFAIFAGLEQLVHYLDVSARVAAVHRLDDARLSWPSLH